MVGLFRRQFLALAAAPALLRGAALSPLQRVQRVLRGSAPDRVPFTLWHHFHLPTPEQHAARTLDFHRLCRTDIVKVMSDFPYPRPAGSWWELRVDRNPFPAQIRALEMIAQGLDGKHYFLETVFNPMNVAEKLSSKEELSRMIRQRPQTLLDALEVITQSSIHHARRALESGAAGIFLAVPNAHAGALSRQEYEQFSAPFDRRILDAVKGARLNVLHLHVEPSYLDLFRAWPAQVISYSPRVSIITLAQMRRRFPSLVLMGGLDETRWAQWNAAQLRQQWRAASSAAGRRLILAPGCSVPDGTKPADLTKLATLLRA
jgi:uroporphyrinogen decarboxylase